MIDNQSCGNYRVRLTDMKVIKNKTKTLQNTDIPIDTLNQLATFYVLLMVYIATYKKSIELQKAKVENKHVGNKKKKNKPPKISTPISKTFFNFLIFFVI